MSHFITLNDKNFKPYIDQQRIATEVKRIAKEINSDLMNEFPIFLAVLNGSFMFASDLLKEIEIPCEISFIKLVSYEGLESSGTVKELIGLNQNIENRTVVIIEDIVDSGVTIEKLVSLLNIEKAKKIKVATVLFKPDAYKKKFAIDYIGFKIPSKFVLGYGLDYAQKYRNLRSIYMLSE